MNTKRPVASRSPRTVSLEPGGHTATSRPTARYAQPKVEPLVFEPMRVPRIKLPRAMVVDMPGQTVEPAASQQTPLPEPQRALIEASRARLAARVDRLRETVADLRLEIEGLRR